MRFRSLPPLLVAGLCFGYLSRYPLTIGRADESFLLYGAKRILEGQVLYRDFFETLPPLSFYLFAGVYRVFGTTLLAARLAISVIEAIGCGLLFHLVRRVAGSAEAVLVSLLFAGVCLPAWPFASPHWITTTLDLLVATVTLAIPAHRPGRVVPFVAGALAGVATCVQQQRGVLLVLWLPLALGVLACSLPRGIRWRTFVSEGAWAGGGAALVIAVVLGAAAWAASPGEVVDSLVGFALKHYGPTFSGRTAWAGVDPMTDIWAASTWLWLLRLAPWFVVGEALRLLRHGRGLRQREDLERAALVLLGGLMMVSILYLPDFIHVSFVLVFLLIPGASLLSALRSAAVWQRVPGARHAMTSAVWVAAFAAAGQCAANVAYARAVAPVRLETAFGTLRVAPDVARLQRAVSAHLVREPDGRVLLYSYPADAWLYLTTPADNATRYTVLVPGFFPEEYLQETIAVLRAGRPGTVVIAIPLAAGAVPKAVEEGYDAVEDVGLYRIYVRRPAEHGGVGGSVRMLAAR